MFGVLEKASARLAGNDEGLTSVRMRQRIWVTLRAVGQWFEMPAISKPRLSRQILRVKVTQENSNPDTYWFDAARIGHLVVRQI